MSSNRELRPGKGSHQTLTPDLIDWIRETFDHIYEYFPTEKELGEEGTITRKKAAQFLQGMARSQNGWEVTNDSFGLKVYRYYAWADGEYRIGLVRPKSTGVGESENSNVDIRLDVRYWYNPEA
jgi:hypothetical protein